MALEIKMAQRIGLGRNNFDKICRACMKTEKKPLQQIFHTSIEVSDKCCSIAELLTAVSTLKFEPNDVLPKGICSECVEAVLKAYNFQIMCMSSDHSLRNDFLFEDDKSVPIIEYMVKEENTVNYCDPQQDVYPNVEPILDPIPMDNDVIVKNECGDEEDQYVCTSSGENGCDGHPQNEADSFDNSASTEIESCNVCHTSDTWDETFDHQNYHPHPRNLHEDNHKLNCNICGETLSTNSHLIDHLNTHSGNNSHVCKFCNKSFLKACILRDHLRTHTGEQLFLCADCGKSFSNTSNLREHQLRHIGIKRHQCLECPSRFTCKSDLLSHINTHRNQKPFVCDICESRFKKLYSLKRHKQRHTGEKPYKCDYCEMRFNSSDHMKRHRRTHTGEKPYACKYCTRSFAQSNDMIRHLRSHVGENVYQCEQCDASFRLNKELKRHVADHFKVENAQVDEVDHT